MVATKTEAMERAIAAECPRGSCIVWHGATWHGAFPRTIPGMRISIANYYRHASVVSQEDFKRSFDPKLADDYSDPVRCKNSVDRPSSPPMMFKKPQAEERL